MSHNTFLKVHIQGSKNSFYLKKPKPRDPKLALSSDNAVKLSKKNDRNNGNNKVNGFDVDRNGVEYAKKSGKLSKSGKSKSKKMSKS